jgi:hypothetical protein
MKAKLIKIKSVVPVKRRQQGKNYSRESAVVNLPYQSERKREGRHDMGEYR